MNLHTMDIKKAYKVGLSGYKISTFVALRNSSTEQRGYHILKYV